MSSFEGEIVLGGILAGLREDLGREQVEQDAILVGRPYSAIEPEKRCAGAFFSAEAEGAIEQPGDEPLEAHRNFGEPPAKGAGDAIDHAATDERLADCRVA